MTDSPANAVTVPGFPEGLLREIDEFVNMSAHNYRFNSRCDTFMNLGGIVLSISIVAAGVYGRADVATILGALVTAIITAQRAFPFNQRWQFYRTLLSQAQNLATRTKNGALTPDQALAILSSLRLDFAQQIPRGAVSTDPKPESDEAGSKKPPV